MKVDWDLAAKIARVASGDSPGMIVPGGLDRRAEEAAEHVIAATGMVPAEPLPAVEWVTRAGWIDANVATMRGLIDPVVERVAGAGGSSAPAQAPIVATAAIAAVAFEIGSLLGMLSRRVLGQLEIDLLDLERSPRLLMVGPNLTAAPERMEVDAEDFQTWVLLHEMTHAVQFTSVPWLREELGSGLGEMLALAEIRPDPRALLRMRGPELRALLRSIRQGGLLGAVAGPEKRAVMERMQGTMGLVEGHAEWAMDAAGDRAIEDVAALRGAMTARRAERPVLLKVLDRVLGFDMKLQQYKHGKDFCDRVAAERGNDGLLAAWSSADTAPTPAELRNPSLWFARVPV
ncbi:MAG: zinc-dependent metalloprotease [Baekduia sp.]